MNHSYIACWKDVQLGLGEEPQQVALIKVSLLTPGQNQWLIEMKLTIEDLLNGRYPVWAEAAVHGLFFKPWNDTLQANGLERSFSEDPIGQVMLDNIQKTLGMPIKFG